LLFFFYYKMTVADEFYFGGGRAAGIKKTGRPAISDRTTRRGLGITSSFSSFPVER